MTRSLRIAPATVFLLALAACSEAPNEAPSSSDPAPTFDTAPPEQLTPERDASTQMAPDPLVPGTIAVADLKAARLTGELGCSFSRRAGEDALLIAVADVMDAARGQAVVRIGGAVEKLTMDRTGGFNAMSKGARFTGAQGLVANVVVSGTDPIAETPRVAMESPRYPASLTFSRAGQTVTVDGNYECGP